MKRHEYVCAFVGGSAFLAGLGVLLVLGQHDDGMAKVGAAVAAAGLGLWFAVPGLRTAKPLLVLGLVTAVALGGWAIARFGAEEGPEPSARETADKDVGKTLSSAEALARGLEWLRAAVARMDDVRDYTFAFAKRERAKSLLGKVRLTDELLAMKIRRKPFSVYLKYLRPEPKNGTEAIYVEGANDGKLLAHSTRPPLSLMGTLRLEPTDWRAMIDQRYPITKVGIVNVAKEVIRVAEDEAAGIARCNVRLLENQEVAGRPCYGYEIENPEPDGGYELALFRILFDQEWKVPVFSERWHYLEVDGKRERLLVEQYTTTDLVFDPGLADKDFDPENPEYGY